MVLASPWAPLCSWSSTGECSRASWTHHVFLLLLIFLILLLTWSMAKAPEPGTVVDSWPQVVTSRVVLGAGSDARTRSPTS